MFRLLFERRRKMAELLQRKKEEALTASQQAELDARADRIAALESALYPFAEAGRIIEQISGFSARITIYSNSERIILIPGDFSCAKAELESTT